MSDRSKEELQQIYNDLLELKETLNWLNSFGDLWPIPMNGRTWEEEKNEFWDRAINAFDGLIRLGKVESCEIRTLCKKETMWCQERKEKKGFWNHVSTHPYHSSEYQIQGMYSLDAFIEATDKLINDTVTEKEKLLINQVLDNVGTSACEPRACIQKDMETSFAYKTDSLQSQKEQFNHRA